MSFVKEQALCNQFMIFCLSGHEFEQTLGDSEGRGGLVCCSPWGCKEVDMTQGLNNNERWKTVWSFFKVNHRSTE